MSGRCLLWPGRSFFRFGNRLQSFPAIPKFMIARWHQNGTVQTKPYGGLQGRIKTPRDSPSGTLRVPEASPLCGLRKKNEGAPGGYRQAQGVGHSGRKPSDDVRDNRTVYGSQAQTQASKQLRQYAVNVNLDNLHLKKHRACTQDQKLFLRIAIK